MLHEPLGFHSIDSRDTVVEFLEEVHGSGQVCLSILDASSKNHAVAAEFFVLKGLGALKYLFDRNVGVDNVAR